MGIKYAVAENFFDDWSQGMAYVLGYLFADGSLEDSQHIRGKYMRVTSTDYDRIESIRILLQSDHSIVKEEKGGNYKPRYLLRIGSHKIYNSLLARGLTPRKSLTMKFPLVPAPFLHTFIRGYFDGDGGVYIEMRANGNPKKLQVVFTSGSKPFLHKLHSILLTEAGVLGRGLYRHGSTKGVYQLRYSSEDSIRIKQFMYKEPVSKHLLMRRKYDIFTRYLELHTAVQSPHLKIHGLVAKKSTRRSAKLICEGANPSQASR